jgi:3-hydroxyacyl-CoA dehydrogenase
MDAINDVVALDRDGDVAVLTVDSPPVNALSAQVRDGLAEGLARALADPEARALVLICRGRTFIAGADIGEFGQPPKGASLHDLNRRIEDARKPVVAAIHGTALGGGFELALACHARVAVPSAKLGLPEVKLGIVPGAGGTQRLPRLTGPAKALELITSGEHVGAQAAAALGLVDAIVPDGQLRDGAVAEARRLAASRQLRTVRDLSDKLDAEPGLFERFRAAHARRFRGFEAPDAAIRCVEAAVTMPFDEGLRFERETFSRLLAGTQSKAQRYVFFAERQVWKVPDIAADTPVLPIAKVGILGAGTMGGGIAMNFANAGLPVTIVEAKPEALERGLGVIRRNYEATAKKGRLTGQEVEHRTGLLKGSLALEDLADCDLVIEAVFETMDVKKEVFGKLDRIAKPGAILASNTSYLDINEIAAQTTRPEHVLGLHFFSPANVMRLVEIVRGDATDKRVIATAMQVARTIGKIGVLVGVCHGFVGNRMLAQRQREANKLVLEGAMPWDVDRVLYEFGFPMGPFAMADLAGLDIGWSRETSRSASLRDILCEMDRRGQKTSAGFYDYDENRAARPSPLVETIILDFAQAQGVARRPVPDEEILERCVYPMINEGAKILEEGKALRASDIDIVWINGYGFPAYRGGPMFYGDTVGLPRVLERMRAFEARMGADFRPAALLERLARDGQGFCDL